MVRVRGPSPSSPRRLPVSAVRRRRAGRPDASRSTTRSTTMIGKTTVSILTDAPRTEPAPTSRPVQSPAQPGGAAAVPEQVELFTDAKSGLWAAITTGVCVTVAATGNLVLLAASLGSAAPPATHWHFGGVLAWGFTFGTPCGVMAGLLRLILPVASWSEVWRRWAISLGSATVAAVASALFVGLLYGVAW